jgi:hypothetical protein
MNYSYANVHELCVYSSTVIYRAEILMAELSGRHGNGFALSTVHEFGESFLIINYMQTQLSDKFTGSLFILLFGCCNLRGFVSNTA